MVLERHVPPAVVCTFLFLSLLASFWQLRRQARRSSARHKRFRIIDEVLDIYWLTLKPIDELVDHDLVRLDAQSIDYSLRGPFHAHENCAGHLSSNVDIGAVTVECLPTTCSFCRTRVVVPQAIASLATEGLPITELKRAVLLRLQQHQERGERFSSRLTFDDIPYRAVL